jgi:hypothetical protein
MISRMEEVVWETVGVIDTLSGRQDLPSSSYQGVELVLMLGGRYGEL